MALRSGDPLATQGNLSLISMKYKFAWSDGELELASGSSDIHPFTLLDRLATHDIYSFVVGRYDGQVHIDWQEGFVPSPAQLEYIIEYDLSRYSAPRWDKFPIPGSFWNWGEAPDPGKVESLDPRNDIISFRAPDGELIEIDLDEWYEYINDGLLKPVMAATVEDTEPEYNFGFMKEPHNNLYPAAFGDDEKLRPEASKAIKQHVLRQLAANHYEDADDWIYFTVYGSGASYNWDEDGDFDVQMWVDFEAFNTAHPEGAMTADELIAEVRRVVQMINFPSFKDLGLDTEDCEGRMLIQFYPKPGKGTPEENLASKPYSCYDVETDEWLQKPRPITPTFYGEHFIMVHQKAQDIAVQAEALLSELERNSVNWQFWTQMYNAFHNDKYKEVAEDSRRNAEAEHEGVKTLFEGVFGGRQQAYSPEGLGIEDERDVIQKLLEVWGIFQKLKHFSRQPMPWEEQELPEEKTSDVLIPQNNFFCFCYTQDQLFMDGTSFHYQLVEDHPEVADAAENESIPQVWGQLTHSNDYYEIAWWSDYMESAIGDRFDDEDNIDEDKMDQVYRNITRSSPLKEKAAQAIADRLGTQVKSGVLTFEPNLISEKKTTPDYPAKGPTVADAEYWQPWRASKSFIPKTADWSEIMDKAQQLRQENAVQITQNGAQHVEGLVASQSEPGVTYQTSFEREDPNSQAITQWTCTCPWGEVSWGRTRQWKKFEGRPCKHLLALYWNSLSTPVSEDRPEAQGQGQLFNPQDFMPPLVPGTTTPTPTPQPQMQAPPGTPQGVMPIPPTGIQAPAPPPPPAQSQITKPGEGGTVAIPGTFSKLKNSATRWDNGDTVRNKIPMYGETRDGDTMLVPAGSRGTVLFADNLETIAIFPLDEAGILEPHLVRVQEPTENFAKAQGDPFVRRRSKLLHYR